MPLFQNVISNNQKALPTSALLADLNPPQGTRGGENLLASPSLCPFGSQDAQTGAAGGLVPSLTSDTRLKLDSHQIRCKRLYRAVKTSARLHEEEMQADKTRFRSWFITLTYRPGVAWEPLHITKAIKSVRAWCDRLGVRFRYVWVAEVQERRQAREGGHCLHYHLLVFLPVHLQLPKFDKRGWWPHVLTQTVKANKPVAYMAKYASKGSQAGFFPKGARLHGCGGLFLDARLQRSWWLCPAYIRDYWPDYACKPQRAQGGGWIAKAIGEWIPSAYRIVSYNPLVVVKRSFPSIS